MKFRTQYLLVFFLLFFLNSFSQSERTEKNIFTKADSLRGALSQERLCYNVLSYNLDVKVDVDNKYISGSNTIKFKAEQDFKKLQIDLFANMQIEKINYKGVKLKFKREFNAVFVDFPEPIIKGIVDSFTVYYSGNPQSAKHAPWDGGFSWNIAPPDLPKGEVSQRGKQADVKAVGSSSPSARLGGAFPWVGVSCQGTGASCWWPCKDHQSDEPDNMYIRITVPVGLSAISNGRLIKTSVNNKDWTTYEWYVSYPINNYDVTLNIANYSHFSDVYKNLNFKDTLTLDYFVLPANLEKAKKHFKQVKPMMDCYYQLLGEYPFVRDGYKLVETPYLGMEHQSCISYGNNYLSGYLGKDLSETGYLFDYIIIHESAHEWWGNSITTNDIADMWIHEGFATYTEALYVEYMYGYNAYLKYINSEKDNVKNNKPVIGIYNLNNKGADDMYSKGALLLHTVRSIINDDKQFFEILKGIQDTFRYQTINSKDIENYISQKSGKNFSKIVDVYLRCASIPKLQYTIESDSLNLKIKYRYSIDSACVFANNDYQNKNGLFTMPVKITFKKNYFKIIYPTTLWKTITIYNMKKENFKVAEDLFYMDVEQKN